MASFVPFGRVTNFGSTPEPAAHGLLAAQGFFAAHGLQGLPGLCILFLAAPGLHGLHGLQGLCIAAIRTAPLLVRLCAAGFSLGTLELAAITGAAMAIIIVAPKMVDKAVVDLILWSKDFTIKTPY